MKTKGYALLVLVLMSIFILNACGSSTENKTAANTPEPTAEEKPLTVRKLTLEKAPDKTVYEVGDEFDPAGTVINAQMSDGSVQENVPFEVDVTGPLDKSISKVKFSYGGKKIEQYISVLSKGNNEMYSVANTPVNPESPLAGKVFYFLGASVTAGSGSGGESMADYIAKIDGAVCIKEAVSGTTLADIENTSGKNFIQRFDAYLSSDDCRDSLDAFICQLSTNDKNKPEIFGTVTAVEVTNADAFDKSTTFGAMEYIIARTREKWNCPIFFYTNTPMNDENYATMVEALYEIAEKWNISVIDLYNDAEFNNITDEERVLYMADSIHPTKAGYRDWWTPKFEEALKETV